MSLLHFVVQAAIRESLFIHTCCYCVGQLYWLLHCKASFKVVAAKATMTSDTLNNWTPWYIEEPENKLKCWKCRYILQ